MVLPGFSFLADAPSVSASPAPSYGRVSVSGTSLLIDGDVTTQELFGVVETTALQNAILAYIEGEGTVAGRTSHLNGPDTSSKGTIPYHATAEQFWHQYFALTAYYDCNMVRLGAGDAWGSRIQYLAWLEHHDEYISMLKLVCAQAEQHGVWVCLVMAGSQEYPAYAYGGSGSVFDTSSTAYSRYIAYVSDVTIALEGEGAVAMYDMFNEPDHDSCYTNYWSGHGGKAAFSTWSKAVAADTAGLSTHPRTMGVAGLGKMFGWGLADFKLATGGSGFEILHRHYYASASGASNTYLFSDPEAWADACGKPLYWGELGYNGVYPLTRWAFGEQSIWAAGGQMIGTMVLTGTANYPYAGGLLPDPVEDDAPGIEFTSDPVVNATVNVTYAYHVSTSVPSTLFLDTDAPFLAMSSNGSVSGLPDAFGAFTVSIRASASERSAYQNFTLLVPGPDAPEARPEQQVNANGSELPFLDQDEGDNTAEGSNLTEKESAVPQGDTMLHLADEASDHPNGTAVKVSTDLSAWARAWGRVQSLLDYHNWFSSSRAATSADNMTLGASLGRNGIVLMDGLTMAFAVSAAAAAAIIALLTLKKHK